MPRNGPTLRVEALEARDVPAVIGALDPTFNGGQPLVTPLIQFNSVALQPDGGVVAVGGNVQDFVIERVLPTGTVDTNFGTAGTGQVIVDIDGAGGFDNALAVKITPAGKIVVAGVGGVGSSGFAVVQLSADGKTIEFNKSFPVGPSGSRSFALDVAFQSDGTIVLAGGGKNGTNNDITILRVSPTGTLLGGPTFVPGSGDDHATGVAVYPDGPDQDKILVVGTAATGTGPVETGNFLVAQFLPDGTTPDPAFNGGSAKVIGVTSQDVPGQVAIGPDGKVVVVGTTTSAASPATRDIAVLKLTDTGAFDPAFNGGAVKTIDLGGGTDDLASAVAVQSDNRIVVGGTEQPANKTGVVRLNSDGGLDAAFGGTGIVTFNDGGAFRADSVVPTPTGRIVLGGAAISGGQGAGFVARLIGTVGRPRDLSVGGAPFAVANVYAPIAPGQYDNPPVRTAPTDLFARFPNETITEDVRTATGDVNGDGFEDTILLTGPARLGQMAVLSGKDNSVLLAPTDPYGDPGGFFSGGFVTAGDIDGDGRAEWVVTPNIEGGPRVIIFGLNTDGTLKLVANFFGIQDPSFRDGARAALGDVNGDGILDVFCIAAFNGGPRTALFDGKDVLIASGLNRQPNKLTGDFFAAPSGTDDGRGGRSIAAGDVDGDGIADFIVTGDIFNADPDRVTIFSGADLAAGKAPGFGATVLADFRASGLFTNPAGVGPAESGTDVATVDSDGDGKADLVIGAAPIQLAQVKAYRGKDLSGTTEPTSTQFAPFGATVGTNNGVFVG
jgi:uncharacterized delta-60 repeat protein